MTKTILVADDSKTIQTVVTLTFRATDFRVVSAGDGDEAMRKVAELRPDIVLADVAMPGKNGYELCMHLKNSPATANVPVLLLAGAFEPFDDRRARDARADGHIKKPFDTQSLLDRVKSLTGAQVAPELPMSFAASLAARSTDGVPARPPSVVPQVQVSESSAAEQARLAQARAEAARSELMRDQMRAAPPPRTPPPLTPPPLNPPPLTGTKTPAATMPALQPRAFAADLGMPNGVRAESFGGNTPAPGGWANALAPTPPPPQPPSPFGPPRSAEPAPPQRELVIEDPEVIEDGEIIEDYDNAAGGPSLEPPSPPGEAARARADVDVWALADPPPRSPPPIARPPAPPAPAAKVPEAESDIEAIEEIDIDEIPAASAVPNAAASAAQRIADRTAAPIAAAAQSIVPGMGHEELVAIAREVIEKIAWEVVPDLAEVIIRAELQRLLQDQD